LLPSAMLRIGPLRNIALALAAAGLVASCKEAEADRGPETIAVEEKAGDFLDYHAEVLRLAQAYSASPDSFKAALDSLPGSHLTDEEWEAWTEPYREQPGLLADRLEQIIADLSTSH